MKVTRITVVLGLAVLVATPRVAAACSRPACLPGSVAPADALAIPSAPPALVIHPPTEGQSPAPNAGDSHLTRNGAEIALSIASDAESDDFLVIPSTPLASGTYVLSRGESCEGTTTPRTSTFIVGGASSLPQTLGVLTTTAVGETTLLAPASPNGCPDYVDAAVLELSLAPSAELAAWQPLVRYTVEVDGSLWARSDYGSVFGASNAPYLYGRTVDHVYASCEPLSPMVPPYRAGLSEGAHHAVLSAHVAGSANDPTPIGFDFQLTCHESPVSDGGAPDGGYAPRVVSGGCTFGGSTPRATWPVVSVLALFLVRRRRTGVLVA